jgi:hypothetical protein
LPSGGFQPYSALRITQQATFSHYLAIRKSISEQGTYVQQGALAYGAKRGRTQPVYSGGDNLMIAHSNWSKSKFYDVYFILAVVKRREGRNYGDLANQVICIQVGLLMVLL